jgi:TonB family protein
VSGQADEVDLKIPTLLFFALLGLFQQGAARAQPTVSPETPQLRTPALDQFYKDHPDLRPAMRPSPAPARTSAAPREVKPCAGPAYPREARRLGQKGAVELKFLIDAEGAVTQAEVQKSSGFPLLDEAGLAAIRLCKFHPALKDGRLIDSWHAVSYKWALD